jgi:hypothetical protein
VGKREMCGKRGVGGGNAPMIQRMRKKGRKRMVRIVISDSRARPLGWLEGE